MDNIKAIDQLVHLAWQFGPFAFAMIFLVGMAVWGQKTWEKVTTRKSPVALQDERNTYRFYFIAMTGIGVSLVGLSIYWWWNHQPNYLWEGQIESLAETDTIEGKDVFVRNEYYQQGAESPQFRDVHFLIKQSQPFEAGQEIDLRYFRDRRLSKPLLISIAPDERPTFRLRYDDEKQEWLLVKKARQPATKKAGFFSQAFAQSLRGGVVPQPSTPVPFPPIRPSEVTPPPQPPQYVDCVSIISISPALQQLVRELQAPETLVSRKVALLDVLGTTSQKRLGDLFLVSTLGGGEPVKEPVFVTLMDLTRHTDMEVSSKARRVLTAAPLPTEYFYLAALSKNAKCKSDALNAFLRLEPKYADSLIADLDRTKADTTALKQITREGNHWRPLVPTGTSAGDRYFVRGEWNVADSKITKCLDNVAQRSAQEQKYFGLLAPMDVVNPKEGQWLTSASQKGSALRAASDLQRCGAKATFVGYYADRK